MLPSVKVLSPVLSAAHVKMFMVSPALDEGVRGRGGNPRDRRSFDGWALLGEPCELDADDGGRGGIFGGLRLADCGRRSSCACPGHAAPGRGTAASERIARAAEIALRLADPRSRGVGGEAWLLLLAPTACPSGVETTACGEAWDEEACATDRGRKDPVDLADVVLEVAV